MSILRDKDLHTPMTTTTIQKVLGVMQAVKTSQDPAADLTHTFVADHAGKVRSLYIVMETPFVADEAMTINVTQNGTSIMTGLVAQNITATSTAAGAQVELDYIKSTVFAAGDVIAIVRDYTDGGGADSLAANCIGIEWS